MDYGNSLRVVGIWPWLQSTCSLSSIAPSCIGKEHRHDPLSPLPPETEFTHGNISRLRRHETMERLRSPHADQMGLLKEMVESTLFHQASGSLRVTTTLALGFEARISCPLVKRQVSDTTKSRKKKNELISVEKIRTAECTATSTKATPQSQTEGLLCAPPASAESVKPCFHLPENRERASERERPRTEPSKGGGVMRRGDGRDGYSRQRNSC